MGALVLALNPSIDAEWRVERAQWEEKNVVQSERRWAGGKGVNVARWLHYLRADSRLLLPLGGTTGKELAGYLHGEHLLVKRVSLQQATRVNVIVTTAEGRQLRFNPAGPELSGKEWQSVLLETERLLPRTSCLILSGSLPRGIGAGAYAELVRRAQRAGVPAILDCDGRALVEAVAAKPFLVKPNEHELAEWFGRPIHSQKKILHAALSLSGKTSGWVMVSQGPRGALLVNQKLNVELSARVPRLSTVNTVGAGDALVAAIAQQISAKSLPEAWLRWGVAIGTAATQCAAGKLPPNKLIHSLLKRVTIS